ncbi:DUF5700 domain-containing putative Zn-dependent protease [Roseisolibacter agri]|uniref:Peptidase MA-like domain-containing protein n=1 Tax=Roseisolibacter agri TaxID=2014610 RepID=A0AA37Q4A3_9BACT|nr:DUF5700 domain-containing putative Zn-dependent protease [Roseisolibacter agri]GLC26094.1 hypothetical protein rosag_26070 [Roseisolibacter agri]
MSFPPFRAARRLARAARLPFCALVLALPLRAQPAAPPSTLTWAQLAAAPGASSQEVAWLKAHLSDAERAEVSALVGALSAPAAAQVMGSYLFADGSVHVPFTGARALADSLYLRPADGLAGRVRVAYLAARLRVATREGWERLGVFATEFRGAPGDALAKAPTLDARVRPARGVTLDLRLDFAPAESLLAVVGTPDVAPTVAAARLRGPAFDALVAHRNQRFYSLPWTRELMALNVARAASTLPVDRLYAWANPKGFLDYADVARHGARYRALLDTLHVRGPALLDGVVARIAPYLPAGTRLDRTVSLFFADGADGWASSGVAAVDLEWFKDDWPRLRGTLTHETFHAAQAAVRRPSAVAVTARDSVLRRAAEALFSEGTANWIAPARDMPAEERAAAVRLGSARVDSVVAAVARGDVAGAHALVDRGISGAGPFYALGEAMTATIVEALGPSALADVLPRGGVAFVKRYSRAVSQRGGTAALLTTRSVSAIAALRD